MKMNINGTVREMTVEETTAIEYQQRLSTIQERNRPLTEGEVYRLLISQQVNTLSVDDSTALRMKGFYPEWSAGVAYEVGFKVQRNGSLWRALQAHTSQAGWEPENVASLWVMINETHEGSIGDPIPYGGNMELNSDKYYIQDNVIYLCYRDTINPVYQPLKDLVGLYVEVL